MSAALVVQLTGSTVVLDGEVLTAGDAAVVCTAARKLIERGYDPVQPLEVWRGDPLCLAGPLGTFAQLTVEARSDGRPTFRIWRTRQQDSGAPPRIAENTRPSTPVAEAAE
jgi:hypothetical protein